MITQEFYQASGQYVDRSSKIVTGGTSQPLMQANGNRRRLLIQNPVSATSQGIGAAENLFVRFIGPASTSLGNSIELLPGGSYDSGNGPCTIDAINVVAATTGHQYFAVEMT